MWILLFASATHDVHLKDSAFAFNSDFYKLKTSLDSQTGSFVYLHSVTTCKLGSVHYASENASSGHFTVSREFAKDVCALPKDFNTLSNPKYMQFLDKWGTVSIFRITLVQTYFSKWNTYFAMFQALCCICMRLQESFGLLIISYLDLRCARLIN